jgi:DNA-binding GntR family transcriptional regulator
VSHSTARRALAKLKEMGMTDTVPGYATFVRFPDQGVPS